MAPSLTKLLLLGAYAATAKADALDVDLTSSCMCLHPSCSLFFLFFSFLFFALVGTSFFGVGGSKWTRDRGPRQTTSARTPCGPIRNGNAMAMQALRQANRILCLASIKAAMSTVAWNLISYYKGNQSGS